MTDAAPPIRLNDAGRIPLPRERILDYLATVREARSCLIRTGSRLTLPLWRVEAILRELAREGLVERRDAHLPPGGRRGERRHVVLYRLAGAAGGGP